MIAAQIVPADALVVVQNDDVNVRFTFRPGRLVQRPVARLPVELQRRRGMSEVFICHDLAVVRVMSHRVIEMQCGGVVESGGARALFNAPQQPGRHELLAAAHGA